MSGREPWRPRRRTVSEVERGRARGEAPAPDSAAPSLDVLQAGLAYLMSRYAADPCPGIAAAVVDQLTALCRHPQMTLLPVQGRLYASLLNEWRCRLPSGPDHPAPGLLH
jgi:hypothetical protein